MSYTTLRLFKENFKFSSAHFLIFNETSAERLHGHNYQVSVELKTPEPGADWSVGYFINFTEFKQFIKARLDAWDEYVLLPAKHPDIKTEIKGESLELRFRERFYVFPRNEVILLPVVNTSVEALSKILAQDIFDAFKNRGLLGIKLCVEETPGQGAVAHLGEVF